ncbi:MAG: hypothetical protein NC338_08470 [Firmicutes bacterium]|nr:hypothetical protein [Bacillota bacterium]MCM1401887.1 hypothetical protein [Bacteroides sp.]MCM1477889.1 hypothetical protein [Bacteroides sp.]
MLQLILSPRRGWEDVAVDNFPSQCLLKSGFVPLIILVSLTCLPSLWYHSDATLAAVLERMVAYFVTYLTSYYIASLVFSLYIPSCTDGVMSLNKNNTFILYNLGILAVLNILTNLLPMVPDMLYLLPVYVYFIMWRGIAYMEVKFNGVILFMVLNLVAVLLPPFLLRYLFNLIIG